MATLGGLVGLNATGCVQTCEYGTPEATYHVKGIVTDEQGVPIEGIGLHEIEEWNDDEGDYQVMGYGDTTDRDGRYSLDFPYAFPNQPIMLDVHDIDGPANGNYKDTVVWIDTEGVQLNGGDEGWYEGEGSVTYNITLKEKTNK